MQKQKKTGTKKRELSISEQLKKDIKQFDKLERECYITVLRYLDGKASEEEAKNANKKLSLLNKQLKAKIKNYRKDLKK